MNNNYDVIILGSGPAGLTAGIYLARARHSVLILDEGTVGGQVTLSHAVANYPGVEEISGYKLGARMKKQAQEFGCKIISNCEITGFDIQGIDKVVEVDDEDSYTSKAVIIAVGGVPRNLGIESEQRLKGSGISYCATCDGDFFQDKDIVVVGGGNSALEEAVSLTKYASSVTVVHQFDNFQAYRFAVKDAEKNDKISFMMEAEVIDFVGNDNLEKVLVKSINTGKITEIDASGAFIFIGYIPNSEQFKGILKLTDSGEIITDDELRTNISGVFAAGDVRAKKVRQITTAVADGTISALSAVEYIRKEIENNGTLNKKDI